MTRFASFIASQQDGQTPVRINPARVVAVIAVLTPNGRASEFSAIEVGDRAIEVVGSVAEVVAALESATAPPVEVAPTDLERAAIIVDLLAEASETEDGELWTCFGVRAVDAALGLGDCGFDDTSRALRALAAKLRGGHR